MCPKCEQGGQLVEHVLESIQCSNNSSLSWHSGNIARKFPILSQAHNRPCFQAMTSCKKIHSFIPMVTGFMPRQRPFPLSSDHVSLDLSKAFDRVDWRSLWEALRLHGVSPHLIWLLQMTYANQKGQMLTNTDTSHEFDICAGVRQGCVLSPRLFCSVLQLAMGRWRKSS